MRQGVQWIRAESYATHDTAEDYSPFDVAPAFALIWHAAFGEDYSGFRVVW